MAEIKGTALIDTIKAIKARSGAEGFEKILNKLNGEARSIFEGRVSPSSWYPLDAFVDFLETDVRETANGDREVLIARSEKVIETHLRGIYKVFVQLGSPAFVVKRISAIHATYFKGVNIIPELSDANEAVIKYAGFQPRHEIMGYVILGFFRKALEISGAKQVTVKWSIPISVKGDYAEVKITWA